MPGPYLLPCTKREQWQWTMQWITVNIYLCADKTQCSCWYSLCLTRCPVVSLHYWKSRIDVKVKNATLKWFNAWTASFNVISTPTDDPCPRPGKMIKAVATFRHNNTSHVQYTDISVRMKVSVIWWSHLRYIKVGYVEEWTSVFNLQYITDCYDSYVFKFIY